MAGKTAKCPHCGGQVRIPDPNGPERPQRSRPSSQGAERPKRRRRPQAEEVYDAEDAGGGDDYDFGGGDEFDFGGMNPNAGVAVQRPDRKPCRACGEMIMKKAAKCRFCGEIFDPALKRRKKKGRKRSRSRYSDEDDEMQTGDWLFAFFCSGIGCILGIIWMIQGKPKGIKMLGASIVFDILKSIVVTLVQEA